MKNSTQGITETDVQILRNWLDKTENLPRHLDDYFLETFLRASKGSQLQSQIRIQKFFAARIKCPIVFDNLDPCLPGLESNLKVGYQFPLPKTAPDGSTIIISGVFQKDAKYSVVKQLRHYLLIVYMGLLDHDLGNGKHIIIADCSNLSVQHLQEVTPSIIHSWVESVESVFPVRTAAVHFLNLPSYAEWAFFLLKKLLKSKLVERIHCHSSPRQLLECYPKRILPEDYGGEEKSIKTLNEKYRQRMIASRSRFLKEENLLKCVINSTSTQDLATGSFKSLHID